MSTTSRGPSRRTLVKGAAWSVPVVAVAGAAPAIAASPPCLAVTYGDATCKSPTEGTYDLQYCFTHNCGSGILEVTITRIRSKNGGYDIPVNVPLTLAPGETDCATFEDLDASNMANFQQVFFRVGDGEEQMRELPAPPNRNCPVPVPDVVGSSEAEAIAAIQAAGYVAAVVRQASDDVEAGVVISQDPVGGTVAAPGSTVTIYVSTGPATDAAQTSARTATVEDTAKTESITPVEPSTDVTTTDESSTDTQP